MTPMTAELEEAILDLCDWLDYEPTSLDDVLLEIKRLNSEYIRAKLAERKKVTVHE